MKVISKEYEKLIQEMHQNDSNWGTNSAKYLKSIMRLVNEYDCKSILDYGCGKGLLEDSFKELQKTGKISKDIVMTGYDPGIPEKNTEPVSSDLLFCKSVLEHIEPEFIDNVLEHIESLAKKVVYLKITTTLAGEILPDGRNAHLIVEPADWWFEKLEKRFNTIEKYIWKNRDAVFIGLLKDKK